MVIINLVTAYYYLPNVARDVDHGGERQRERELKRREAYISATRELVWMARINNNSYRVI